MTTRCISRVGIQKVAMSMMIAATAVAAGSTILTRTAAADDYSALADQISASDPNGDQQMTVQDGAITQSTPVADRNVIDPGSLARVNQFVNDSDGNTYRAVGFRWTSVGVAHNKLTLTRMVSYSVAPEPVSCSVAPDPVVVVNTVPTVGYYPSYYGHSYYPHIYAHGYAHSYAHGYAHGYAHAYPSVAYSHSYHMGYHHH